MFKDRIGELESVNISLEAFVANLGAKMVQMREQHDEASTSKVRDQISKELENIKNLVADLTDLLGGD